MCIRDRGGSAGLNQAVGVSTRRSSGCWTLPCSWEIRFSEVGIVRLAGYLCVRGASATLPHIRTPMPAITAAPIRSLLLLLCLAMVACQREAPVEAPSTIVDMPATTELGGAISGGVTPSPAPKAPGLEGTQWPPVELTSGEAWVNCSVDDVGGEQGVALTDLSFSRVVDALTPCEEAGVLRVGYSGKIGADFTALVERVANVAGRLKISRRLLDLDSSGGHIEDAMKAGDAIGRCV